jgi:hypothetical protein
MSFLFIFISIPRPIYTFMLCARKLTTNCSSRLSTVNTIHFSVRAMFDVERIQNVLSRALLLSERESAQKQLCVKSREREK